MTSTLQVLDLVAWTHEGAHVQEDKVTTSVTSSQCMKWREKPVDQQELPKAAPPKSKINLS